MQEVLSLILGGGRGTRLYPLTKQRSKPAVPIAGKYRLIDIPISNCINSGTNRIFVLTQFLSVSLHRHIANTYKFDPFSRGFVEILAAQQTNETAGWYQGTADAVRQNLRYIRADGGGEILILSGDQLYRMDYSKLVESHRASKADVTIAVMPVARGQVAGFGIVRVDEAGRVVGFVEKPSTDEQAEPMRTPPAWIEQHGIQTGDRHFLASMGIYLFNRDVLFRLLNTEPLAADFGREIFPRSISTSHVQAHLFDGYWEDLGTIQSYHEANLALASDRPPFEFHSPEGVIYTHMRNLPASRINGALLENCLVSDGCVVKSGARLERCVLGVRSRIGAGAVLRDTIVLGANYFEADSPQPAQRRGDRPPLGVGDHSVLERVILDKNCRIGRNVQITNRQGIQEAEGDNYVIREGIVVIPNSATVADGTVI